MEPTKNAERLQKFLNSDWAAEQVTRLVEQDALDLGLLSAKQAKALGKRAARILRLQAKSGKPVILVRDQRRSRS